MQIGDFMERLQKVIANSGYCSRRKAEEYIKQGKVSVNGSIVRELGTTVTSKDIVMINGNIIEKQSKEYVLLYKPRGVVTTTADDKKRKTVIDLINTQNRLYPVGRLDYDTTGALILTNDGELTNYLIHPKNKIEKEYIAKLNKIIKGEDIHKLENGILLDNQLIKPKRVKLKKVNKDNNTCMVQIIICEGKNHEVKRIFESIGYKVDKLKRERIAFLTLESLKPTTSAIIGSLSSLPFGIIRHTSPNLASGPADSMVRPTTFTTLPSLRKKTSSITLLYL